MENNFGEYKSYKAFCCFLSPLRQLLINVASARVEVLVIVDIGFRPYLYPYAKFFSLDSHVVSYKSNLRNSIFRSIRPFREALFLKMCNEKRRMNSFWKNELGKV